MGTRTPASCAKPVAGGKDRLALTLGGTAWSPARSGAPMRVDRPIDWHRPGRIPRSRGGVCAARRSRLRRQCVRDTSRAAARARSPGPPGGRRAAGALPHQRRGRHRQLAVSTPHLLRRNGGPRAGRLGASGVRACLVARAAGTHAERPAPDRCRARAGVAARRRRHVQPRRLGGHHPAGGRHGAGGRRRGQPAHAADAWRYAGPRRSPRSDRLRGHAGHRVRPSRRRGGGGTYRGYVARIIDDGSTLQIGLGACPTPCCATSATGATSGSTPT